MKRRIAAALMTLCFSASSLAPALAGEECSQESPAKATVRLPVRLAGLASGTAIGVPLMVSRSVPDTTGVLFYLLGGNSLAENVLAMPVAIPVGTVVGTVCGVSKGTTNAFKNFYTEPFSLKTFSLEEES